MCMDLVVDFFRDGNAVVMLLINIAAIVEKADETILPAVYREMGDSFHASPSALGALTLVRALVQSLSFPLAALAAIRYNRVSVVACGALLWGIATAGVGFSITYAQVAFWRAVNGVGLALVVPAIQSLVADAVVEEERGMAFGWLQMMTNMGGILGSTVGVLMAGTAVAGVSGWRVAFLSLAVISVLIAALLQSSAHLLVSQAPPGRQPEDRSEGSAGKKPIMPWAESARRVLADTKHVMGIPTFQIIVAQGVVGSFPWAAMAFTAMWLELIGFSNGMVALLLGSFSLCTCFGGLFGGWFGDRMERILPSVGRILCSQISSGIAIPMSAILLLVLPQSPSWSLLFFIVLSTMGFLISWNAASTNNPIFAEIVPEERRTSVYAVDRCLESVLAAFAPPTVGYLAENWFGYSNQGKTVSDHDKALALSQGLFVTIAIPFVICCLVYSLLYKTYPKDKKLGQGNVIEVGRLRLLDSLESPDDLNPSERDEGKPAQHETYH